MASQSCGTFYFFFCLGASLWQNYALYRRKSTIGYSTDFALIEFIGFTVLLFNQLTGLVDPYSPAGRIHVIDVLAFLVLFLASSTSLTYTFIYPSDKPYTLSVFIWLLILSCWVFGGILEGYADYPMSIYLGQGVSWVRTCGLINSLTCFSKYTMQTLHNYRKKSVTGLSPATMALDLGCTASGVFQLQFDSWANGYGFFLLDPRLNVAKVCLLGISGAFCSFILV